MDYEKAYKNLVAKVKNAHLYAQTDSTKNVLEDILPELRESEDENLKNKSGYYKAGKFWKASTLWNAVNGKSPQRVPNRYILQECTWNISSLQHFADEVKNVQEVDLNYPIILDMNGNILDGAHRVVKAYLEGKDVDIVYLGDDEWPEPDYDEEKAVKESEDERIRKYLIDELKVAKSVGELKFTIPQPTREECIAYLEKQKEPTTEELYAEAGTTEKEYIANTMKMVRAMRERKKEQKPISQEDFDTAKHEALWDEQKPAWSEEDTDMLNCCISSIEEAKENRYAYKETDGDTSYDREIAWLKSLRPSWKPSEEQMKALKDASAIMEYDSSDNAFPSLKTLYEQLKKL